jgi:hypothetical protein
MTTAVTTCHLSRQKFPFLANKLENTYIRKLFKNKKSRSKVLLLIECFCFSHVMGLPALAMRPQYHSISRVNRRRHGEKYVRLHALYEGVYKKMACINICTSVD